MDLIFNFSHFHFLSRISNANQRYIEGYLPSSQSDIDQSIITLTRIGLTEKDGDEIKPSLAKSWEISSDGKVYTFHLSEKANAEEVKNILLDSGEDWTDISINTTSEYDLQFQLKKSFAPLLSSLTNPIFEFGPYLIDIQTDTDTVLKSNPDAVNPSKISEIVFKKYSDIKSLSLALKDRQIDGTSDIIDDVKGYSRYTIELNKKPVLLCNLRSAPCLDDSWRDKFFNNKSFDKAQDVKIVAIDNSDNRKILSDEIEAAKKQNVNISIEWVDSNQLSEQILPERKYTLLLTGLDYGIDNDPYPFWHSSQIDYPGLNLSGLKNYDIDQLLERYRITVDQNTRIQYWKEVQEKILKFNIVKIYNPVKDSFLVSNKIKLPKEEFSGCKSSDRFEYISEWTQ